MFASWIVFCQAFEVAQLTFIFEPLESKAVFPTLKRTISFAPSGFQSAVQYAQALTNMLSISKQVVGADVSVVANLVGATGEVK